MMIIAYAKYIRLAYNELRIFSNYVQFVLAVKLSSCSLLYRPYLLHSLCVVMALICSLLEADWFWSTSRVLRLSQHHSLQTESKHTCLSHVHKLSHWSGLHWVNHFCTKFGGIHTIMVHTPYSSSSVSRMLILKATLKWSWGHQPYHCFAT